jgi:hypothetical protein
MLQESPQHFEEHMEPKVREYAANLHQPQQNSKIKVNTRLHHHVGNNI